MGDLLEENAWQLLEYALRHGGSEKIQALFDIGFRDDEDGVWRDENFPTIPYLLKEAASARKYDGVEVFLANCAYEDRVLSSAMDFAKIYSNAFKPSNNRGR